MWPVATRLDLARVENIAGSSTENQNLENFSLSLFLVWGQQDDSTGARCQPTVCPLTSTYVSWHAHTYAHTHLIFKMQ